MNFGKVVSSTCNLTIRILYRIRNSAYSFFNLFYSDYLLRRYNSKLKSYKNNRIFFILRHDYGTFLLVLHYMRLWNEKREKTVAISLTTHTDKVKKLAQSLCRDIPLIEVDSFFFKLLIKIFGHRNVQYKTLNKVYAQLLRVHSYHVILFDQPFSQNFQARNSFSSFLDRNLHLFQKKVDEGFRNAYVHFKQLSSCNFNAWYDLHNLHFDSNTLLYNDLKQQSPSLLNQMNIKLPYVVLNLNCKLYDSNFRNHRSILYPSRYNVLIDELISQGYDVVLQGRDEQPLLKGRKGFVDYSKSSFVCEQNDLLLFSNASFMVSSKTGPENYATIFNIPLLGLNYVEPCILTPSLKFRYFFKHIFSKDQDRMIHWKELLDSSLFFQCGRMEFMKNVEYIDIDSDEILEALKEFLRVFRENSWESPTPAQKEFKGSITPLHLDMYHSRGLPCDCYLTSKKFTTNRSYIS